MQIQSRNGPGPPDKTDNTTDIPSNRASPAILLSRIFLRIHEIFVSLSSKNLYSDKMAFEILETLFRGICVGVAASITVGPVAVLCIQRTLSKNRRSGIISGIGVACADTLMAMIALFFYSMLQTQIEQYNTLLRVIGGIFVVIVGVFIAP